MDGVYVHNVIAFCHHLHELIRKILPDVFHAGHRESFEQSYHKLHHGRRLVHGRIIDATITANTDGFSNNRPPLIDIRINEVQHVHLVPFRVSGKDVPSPDFSPGIERIRRARSYI